jgi:hypothetical protein
MVLKHKVHSNVFCILIFVRHHQGHNRFTWIYVIKHKSDVQSVFLEFQKHVELLLNTKIKAFQSDGGVNTINCIIIFRKMALPIESPALTLNSRMTLLRESTDT